LHHILGKEENRGWRPKLWRCFNNKDKENQKINYSQTFKYGRQETD